MVRLAVLAALLLAGAPAPSAPAEVPPPSPALRQHLSYTFPSDLVAAERADRVAWITIREGVRTVWTAAAPDWRPRRVASSGNDDGQELTGLALSPDGARLAWVRGGDHDANWPAEGGLQPNPDNGPDQPGLAIWTARAGGGPAVRLAEGDAPALSADGRLAYLKDGQAWTAPLDGGGRPARLFFDRGRVSGLAWSPDGRRLAFVSRRSDHSLIGVFEGAGRPIRWLAPSTARDGTPVWSPDGRRIAFVRRAVTAGAPRPMLSETPEPWSILVADPATGAAHAAWISGRAAADSHPDVLGGANLAWAAGDRLTFLSEADGWPHLYAVPAAGGAATLLTPGRYAIEEVARSPDGASLTFTANTGPLPGDDDRRHLFRVAVTGGAPVQLVTGDGNEWGPAATRAGTAYIGATAKRPPTVRLVEGGREIGPATTYPPAANLVVPRPVTFRAADGLLIHGQLFAPAGGAARKPAVIFVHGGPSRQMLLGWHMRRYYAHSYALNQYLVSRGFVVLSINYRLGIMYGRAFQHAAKAGPAGAAEYQDVVAGARFLRGLPQVDDRRIGIWGGSYGGYLTALALARDSDLFAAGVDLHGVHDWSRILGEEVGAPTGRYEQGDWMQAMKTAFAASPVADIAMWRSPVLLIHGDDDRNVRVNQTVDLVGRLEAKGVPFEELLIPNETHDFLRHESWLRADAATAAFLEAQLRP